MNNSPLSIKTFCTKKSWFMVISLKHYTKEIKFFLRTLTCLLLCLTLHISNTKQNSPTNHRIFLAKREKKRSIVSYLGIESLSFDMIIIVETPPYLIFSWENINILNLCTLFVWQKWCTRITYKLLLTFLNSPEGIERLCSDVEVDHTDVRILMLAW